jgi:hypothetical protein
MSKNIFKNNKSNFGYYDNIAALVALLDMIYDGKAGGTVGTPG